jgi:hypothetical protein
MHNENIAKGGYGKNRLIINPITIPTIVDNIKKRLFSKINPASGRSAKKIAIIIDHIGLSRPILIDI